MSSSCFSNQKSNSPDLSERKGLEPFQRNAYDAENRLISATPATLTNGAVRVLNAYDHRHRRIRKTVQRAQSGSEADEVPFRFSTKYFDPETGLDYYGYRFYSPEWGRWINRDPIGEEGGMNLYDFARNNPITLFDKDGCAYFAYRPLNAVRWIGVVGNFEDDLNNTVIGHENLFFELSGVDDEALYCVIDSGGGSSSCYTVFSYAG